MPRALSVGTRWSLLYTMVTMLALSLPIGFIYVSVHRRIERDARLLLDSYLAEVRGEVEEHPESPGGAVEFFTARLRRITPELDYGSALLRKDGSASFRVGSLADASRHWPLHRLAPDAPARVRSFHSGGADYLVASVPVSTGSLFAAISNRSFIGGVDQIRRLVLFASPLALLVSGLCGAWLARRSLRPIANMTASARRISGENLSERIPSGGTDDELDRLAETLNDMLDRIGDAMLRLRGFSADAAHQLKSPIASLQNEIEVTLESGELEAPARHVLEGILIQVRELGTSVGAMLRLARSESGLSEGQGVPVDLGRLLDGVATLFQPMAEDRGIELQLHASTPVEIVGDVAWLRELFANLVQNAIDHTPARGSVAISLLAKPSEVEVQVVDTGEGIPRSEHDRIFDRFHRTSPSRHVPGSGLGLALAKQIATAHGGRITLESDVGHGSTFRVFLPRHHPRRGGSSVQPAARILHRRALQQRAAS